MDLVAKEVGGTETQQRGLFFTFRIVNLPNITIHNNPFLD